MSNSEPALASICPLVYEPKKRGWSRKQSRIGEQHKFDAVSLGIKLAEVAAAAQEAFPTATVETVQRFSSVESSPQLTGNHGTTFGALS